MKGDELYTANVTILLYLALIKNILFEIFRHSEYKYIQHDLQW